MKNKKQHTLKQERCCFGKAKTGSVDSWTANLELIDQAGLLT